MSLRGIRRAFDGAPVLRGVDLDVAKGEIVCLLGPSGCGKTTLLRIIAGLEEADSGEALVVGQSLAGIAAHERDFGLMFQEYALFPHMNVEKNILFGLRMKRWSKAEQRARLGEILKLVGLTGFEGRDVAQLSGGERQRVALARSLAPNPRLLMLDEPLGSLDATLRERLVVELRQTLKRVGVTALYVTHDQHEAFAVADRIAIMNAGMIEQIGTPEAVYRQPKTTFAARFLGLNNVVPVLRQEGERLHTTVGEFEKPNLNPTPRPPPHTWGGGENQSEPAAILLHPDGLECVSVETPGAIQGRVVDRVFLGDAYRLEIEHESGIRLILRLSSRANDVPEVGEQIGVRVAAASVVSLDAAVVPPTRE